MVDPDGIKPVARTKHVFMCIYADSGVGKTRLIGGYTKGPVLIIRPPTEHTDSIRNPGPNLKEWVVRSWSEMNEVEEYLRHEGHKWAWVWLDSISAFQDTGLDDIWADVVAKKPARKQYGLDKGEYGVNMTRLGQWVRGVVSADEFNFGVTAHPFYGETITGETLLMPYVQGKNMSNKISGYMNLVAYYEVVNQEGKKPVRVLRTSKTEDYFAKDQFDAFGENARMVNPTFDKIVAAIEAARPAAATRTAAKKKPVRKRRAMR